jgi:hypothetical protein
MNNVVAMQDRAPCGLDGSTHVFQRTTVIDQLRERPVCPRSRPTFSSCNVRFRAEATFPSTAYIEAAMPATEYDGDDDAILSEIDPFAS